MSMMKEKQLNQKPLLGIIGGMGTQATACFYENLHSLQKVSKEQEYLDVLLYSIPSTPDRTAYITGQSSENPLEYLIDAAQILESAGATCIAIPCVTSHFFYDDLKKAISIPILNILDETADFISGKGIHKVCLLATDGTIKGRAFHNAFEKHSIEVTTPPEEEQQKLMTLIYDIKRGAEITVNAYTSIINEALKTGADTVVLGCTELCIFAEEKMKIPGVISTLEILAASALRKARGCD